ncbi:MAG: hypothetical protein C4555_06375 [Dehalococcoidia bacterium]|nr:MAG: hypothetical protein C4555_06375 [Dehalococcoidia bacterium]
MNTDWPVFWELDVPGLKAQAPEDLNFDDLVVGCRIVWRREEMLCPTCHLAIYTIDQINFPQAPSLKYRRLNVEPPPEACQCQVDPRGFPIVGDS